MKPYICLIACVLATSAFADEKIDCLVSRDVNACMDLCSKNDGEACFESAFLYDQKQDYEKAARYFEKACDLNIGGGCLGLGYSYSDGKGVKKDYVKAAKYFEKACDLGDRDGCYGYR